MKMDRPLSEQVWHTLYQHTTDPKNLGFLLNVKDICLVYYYCFERR